MANIARMRESRSVSGSAMSLSYTTGLLICVNVPNTTERLYFYFYSNYNLV